MIRPAPRQLRLSDLSAARQALVRLCQSIDFGQITDLYVRDHEPVFDPRPVVLLDVKLDTDTVERSEAELQDFVLRAEILRLLRRLDDMENGRLDLIIVRAGIPRLLRMEANIAGTPR